MSSDFLFELGCEELPSASVKPLAEAFSAHLLSNLDKAQLSYGKVMPFATPRRIGLFIGSLQAEQPSQKVTRRGPPMVSAYDKDNQPTPALLGFAKSCGVGLDELSTVQTDKGDWMVYESLQMGEKTESLLPDFIQQALSALPIRKPMRWGEEAVEFVRPVHWALLLYKDECIDASLLGLKTAPFSRGHRFHRDEKIKIMSPASYEAQLREAYVVADFSLRRQLIIEQLETLARTVEAEVVCPAELVDEVTSIVEWPKALLVHFDEDFLQVPSEALIASMQSHQKCFALKDKTGQLLPYFITVSNIESKDETQVILGNEKVMRARLSDAAFFFHQDKKQPLSAYRDATAQVVFQARLGSLQDKSHRIETLMTHWVNPFKLSEQQVQKASMLSKCDLMTGMVGEFPELQGVMGYYYAINDKEDEAVALAIKEQYLPRFSGDELPQSALGLALSLADRIDTLAGIFAIGQKPSAVKDPFKLRRHALAISRLLTSNPVRLKLTSLIEEALDNYVNQLTIPEGLEAEIKRFILDRLQSWHLAQGYSIDLINAVFAVQDDWLYDIHQRLQALKSFITRSEAAALSAACKRVNNILSTATFERKDVDQRLLEESAEKSLYQDLMKMDEALMPLYLAGDYSQILNLLAGLRDGVDAFFDQVMVMVDNEALKTNRLNILSRLQALLMGVADISLLQLQNA